MPITAEEARQLLGQTPQATAPSAISPEEAKSLLASSAPEVGSRSLSQILSGTSMRFRSPEEAIQEAGGIIPYLRSSLRGAAGGIGAIGAGGAQETARIGKNIFGTLPPHRFNLPPSKALQLLNLIPQKSQEIQQQLIQQHPQEAKVGRILGNIATYGGLGEAIAPGEAISAIARPALKFGAKGLGFLKGAGKFIRPKLVAKGIVENLPKVKSAESILNELGSGRSLNENVQNIAAKIKKAGTTKLKESGERFEDINKRAGVGSLYPEGKPVLKNSYTALEKWKRPPMMHYPDTLKDAHEDFMDIPTFDKAHKLQSTLGSTANRTLKNPESNMQQRDIADRFLMAQDRLLNDMHLHLNKVDPSRQLSTEYDAARNLHASDVIPYKDSKQIREIVKGKVQNPRNLTTIFKNPESNTLKIVKDIGSEAPDQIIYNELRATVGKNPTAEKLIKAYSGLEKKGLKSYDSPKLEQQMENLKQTHAQEEFLKQIGTKPTPERILKAADKLENKDLIQNLSPSVQDQINALRTRTVRAKWIKRGAGIAGLGLLAKEFLPAHLRREIF